MANLCNWFPGPLVLDPNRGIDNERSIRAIHCWVREVLGE